MVVGCLVVGRNHDGFGVGFRHDLAISHRGGIRTVDHAHGLDVLRLAVVVDFMVRDGRFGSARVSVESGRVALLGALDVLANIAIGQGAALHITLLAGLPAREGVVNRDQALTVLLGSHGHIQLTPRAHGGVHRLGVQIGDIVEQRGSLIHGAVLHLVLGITVRLARLVGHDVSRLDQRQTRAVCAPGQQDVHQVAQRTGFRQLLLRGLLSGAIIGTVVGGDICRVVGGLCPRGVTHGGTLSRRARVLIVLRARIDALRAGVVGGRSGCWLRSAGGGAFTAEQVSQTHV